jgi:hypothetical protein
MAKPVTEDPGTLANIINGFGGTVIPGETFRFQLPLSEVREVVPKINQLGIGVRKIGEFEAENPTKMFSNIAVATLELYRPEEAKPEGELREAWFKS